VGNRSDGYHPPCEIFHEKWIDFDPGPNTIPQTHERTGREAAAPGGLVMPGTPQSPEEIRSVGMIYVLVSEFVSPIVLGLLADYALGTSPWGLLIGVIFGLIVGGFGVSRLIRQLDAADKRKKEQQKGPP
jgi:F0F1-type ATP synthase assembly protein I